MITRALTEALKQVWCETCHQTAKSRGADSLAQQARRVTSRDVNKASLFGKVSTEPATINWPRSISLSEILIDYALLYTWTLALSFGL